MNLEKRLQDIVRSKLRGDEVIIKKELYEVLQRDEQGYCEYAFIVVWRSDSRDDERDYGTHRVNFNTNKEEALFSGHYDMSYGRALINFDERMEHAPARRVSA